MKRFGSPQTQRYSPALQFAALVAALALSFPSLAAAADPNALQQGASQQQQQQQQQQEGIDKIIIPMVAYTPETSLLLSGIGMLYSGDQDAADQWRAAVAGVYTLKNQTLATVNYGTRLDEDRYRLGVGVSFANWPEEFFGVGSQVSLASEEVDVLRVGLRLRALRRVSDTDLYAGLLQETEYRDTDAADDGLLTSYRPDAPGSSRRVGLGLRLVYDTRDAETSPSRGAFVGAEAVAFQTAWGSSTDYTRLSVDARLFVPLGDHVLAGQARAAASLGAPPYYDLGELGGSNLLRGIYAGRFRDRYMSAAQAEYRSPLLFWRVSAAAFGGLGMVAASLDAFDTDHLQWAAGGGARILLLEERNLNLRLDYALSADDTGFYLSIGEAF